MAIDNPTRLDVLSGLDDPEEEFGFGLLQEPSADPTLGDVANFAAESAKEKADQEAQDKKNAKMGKRARALDAMASALAVFTSKDPGRAAQAMIEMRVQMINQQKQRMHQEQMLDKQLVAAQEGREFERETQFKAVDRTEAANDRAREADWKVEERRIGLVQQNEAENRDAESELERYNKAWEYYQQNSPPDTDPSLITLAASCAASGGGAECHGNPALEGLRTAAYAKQQETRDLEHQLTRAQTEAANQRRRVSEQQWITTWQQANPRPVLDSKGNPLVDEDGAPIMQPGDYEAGRQAYYQQNGMDGAVPTPDGGVGANPEMLKSEQLRLEEEIKNGNTGAVRDYIDITETAGQPVSVPKLIQLGADWESLQASGADIPREVYANSAAKVVADELTKEGVKKGREGMAAVKRRLALTDLTPEEMQDAYSIAYDLLGSSWENFTKPIQEGISRRWNAAGEMIDIVGEAINPN